MGSYKKFPAVYFLLFILALIPVSTFGLTVTNTNDSGPGSLRQAIADTPPGGVVDFDPSLAGSTITLLSEIVIGKSLTIQGPGADELTLSGGGATRLLRLVNFVEFFRLADLRLTGGNGNGGGFTGVGGAVSINIVNRVEIERCLFEGNHVALPASQGGALGILARGTEGVFINDSTFRNNSVSGPSALGGALAMFLDQSNLEINRSTFNDNFVRSTSESFFFFGGAIAVVSRIPATMTTTNSTFSGNRAECGAPGCRVFGGAVGLDGEATVTFNNNTFSGNTAACSSPACSGTGNTVGVIASQPTTFYSNIITNEPGVVNCGIFNSGSFISLGFNITSDASCVDGTVTGDRPNTNPGLDPAGLRNNGGPTRTIAIFDTSEAFNTGDPACPPPLTDQRGIPRPQAEICDVGSYELFVREEANIPTLSEWGMIAAAAGFVLIGAFYAMRRRKASV